MSVNKIIEQSSYIVGISRETLGTIAGILKTRYPYMSGPVLMCTDPEARLSISYSHRGAAFIVTAETEENLAAIKAIAVEVLLEATDQASEIPTWTRA